MRTLVAVKVIRSRCCSPYTPNRSTVIGFDHGLGRAYDRSSGCSVEPGSAIVCHLVRRKTAMKLQRIARLVVVSFVLLVPAVARAQGSGTAAIAGVVRDTTGAVMPGVTVEAASPALIEKVRSVVTDESGQYKILNLVPGTYSVTFILVGFSAVKREDLELNSSFTATVNADLKVGAIEETVTVSGQAPVVDTQNVRQQTTIARDTLDAIPTTKRLGQYATIIPGATYANAT